MSNSNDYRLFAARERRAAKSAVLQSVRDRHLAAAERWDQLAQEAELFEPRFLKDPAKSEWIA